MREVVVDWSLKVMLGRLSQTAAKVVARVWV
jgi:hypothetical protein